MSRYQPTVSLDPLVEAHPGLPSEPLEASRGQRVAAVVARSVVDVLDQRLVAVGQRQDPPDDLDVRQLVGPAHVVDLARLPVGEHRVHRGAAILDEEPVADLHPVAVDGQRVPGEGVEDAERDQLLGMLVGP